MIIDAADQVAELHALDALSFPINFRRAQCHVPSIDETKVHVNVTQYANIICIFTNIESLYSDNPAVQHTASPPSPTKGELPKKRGKTTNLKVTINLAFAPATEAYPPLIGYDHEPFNVVMPIGYDSIDIDRYKAWVLPPGHQSQSLCYPCSTTIVALSLPFGRLVCFLRAVCCYLGM
jgi:hypothetical protein